ncbi:MAG TPA: homoprotocatechuate degradation operon regulator HpaR, partial [Roseiarcus sp.]|nr:homoprotocatechuate degradation operon regulator HpaR [Roseiarcus sp.]
PMLAQHGVTEQQWRVIRVLSEEGPLGATEVADRAAILGPSLTRIIKTLERRRMITSRRLPHDGRRVVLEIAAAGRAVIASAAPERRKIYRDLERRHGQEALDDLLDRLEALILREQKGAGDGKRRKERAQKG